MMGADVEFRPRGFVRALLWTLTYPFVFIASLIVFRLFDVVDQVLCPVFSYLDWALERRDTSCYCHEELSNFNALDTEPALSVSNFVTDCEFWNGQSSTLHSRRRKHGPSRVLSLTLNRYLSLDAIVPLKFRRSADLFSSGNSRGVCDPISPDKDLLLDLEARSFCVETGVSSSQLSSGQANVQRNSPKISPPKARWSDCGCSTCTAWHSSEDLFVRLGGKEAARTVRISDDVGDYENNVIFIHGFLSSSSFWSETVFPAFSDNLKSTHRLFAVDVLGFGKSPKPTDCNYSNADHVQMIRKSVIDRYKLKKYHLVAHSMGCTIALSLAGQDPSTVRSITLISPLYYPAVSGSQPSSHLLKKVAPRKIWPTLALGPSVMSWYEHLGRVVCLVVCKNHWFWEPVLSFICNKILRWRVPHFLVHDFMQHTHNAAWHNFHNTICSGAYTTDWSMKALHKAGKRVRVLHGDDDDLCPLQCGVDMKEAYSNVHLAVIPGANHVSILLGREKQMALELEEEILRS